jgi:hypothetical protein
MNSAETPRTKTAPDAIDGVLKTGVIDEKRFGVRKGRLALMLTIAASLAACGDAAIGPVDHECHSNPARSQGSGCDERRPLSESDGHLYGAYLDVPRFDAKATAVYAETMDVNTPNETEDVRTLPSGDIAS